MPGALGKQTGKRETGEIESEGQDAIGRPAGKAVGENPQSQGQPGPRQGKEGHEDRQVVFHLGPRPAISPPSSVLYFFPNFRQKTASRTPTAAVEANISRISTDGSGLPDACSSQRKEINPN